ncbi:MAG: hypothetical protein ACXW5U_13095 [Thermoanaerobaculia bacterium]
MATVTVFFYGICTHDRESAPNQVVLLDVSQGMHLPYDVTIQPHTAKVECTHLPTINSGATLEITGGSGRLIYDDSFDQCIPNLTHLLSNPAPLKRSDSLPAAFLFKVSNGTFYGGRTANGAAVSRLVVETLGEEAFLEVTPFGDWQSTRHRLHDDAIIHVSNLGTQRELDDNVYDFLLHFYVLEEWPLDGCVAAAPCAKCQRFESAGFGTVGPGCSCSQYP